MNIHYRQLFGLKLIFYICVKIKKNKLKSLSLISLIFYLLSIGSLLSAQKIALNDKGERIVVFDDGTWRPYVDKDSVLLQNSSSNDFLINDDSDISVFELPPDTIVTSDIKLSKRRKTAEYKKLEEELSILENKLYKFSRDPSIPESDLTIIRNDIQSLKERLKLLNEQKPAETNRIPLMAKVEKDFSTAVVGTNTISFYPPGNFIANPPAVPCDFTSNTVDDFDKRRRVEMNKQILFSYTDPKVKPHLKGDEFLTCHLNLNEVSPYKFINLLFTFSTLTAKREYGSLSAGTAISFLLVNGQTVTLENNTNDPGTINSKKGLTEYKALLPVSSAAEKAFLRSPIDKIRIIWSTGFEDYEVFNVDVLMNQLNCLNSFN